MLTNEQILQIRESFGDQADKVLEAVKFANEKHEGSLRDDGQPYITHPLTVAEYVRTYKQSKNAAMLFMAAVLHDTIEDTYTSYKELCDRFGEEVGSLVMELSTAKFAPLWINNGKGGKAEYLARKMENMTNYALFIKLCDRLHNLQTLKGCSEAKIEKTLHDTRIILDYLTVVRDYTASQERVVKEIEKILAEYKK